MVILLCSRKVKRSQTTNHTRRPTRSNLKCQNTYYTTLYKSMWLTYFLMRYSIEFVPTASRLANPSAAKMFTLCNPDRAKSTTTSWNCWSWSMRARSRRPAGWRPSFRASRTRARTRRTRYAQTWRVGGPAPDFVSDLFVNNNAWFEHNSECRTCSLAILHSLFLSYSRESASLFSYTLVSKHVPFCIRMTNFTFRFWW